MEQNKWLTFNEYQTKAKSYDFSHQAIVYPTLGLNGEAGEVAEKVKKVLRDRGGEFDRASSIEIAKELGDCLWYIAITASDLGFSLEEIAELNLSKISSRFSRNVIHGEGDNR